MIRRLLALGYTTSLPVMVMVSRSVGVSLFKNRIYAWMTCYYTTAMDHGIFSTHISVLSLDIHVCSNMYLQHIDQLEVVIQPVADFYNGMSGVYCYLQLLSFSCRST